MTPNILLSQSERQLEDRFGDWFIAHLPGEDVQTLRQFYEEMADVLEFPDGFGVNLDALNDALNDLQWLEDDRIVLYFTRTDLLISKERDPAKLASVLNVLDATAEDWKWTDDSDLADRKELVVVFEDSPRIRQLLEKEHIDFQSMADLA
ncbi:hypothetical protein GCM10027578_32890 [Spirosoma luteolum]